MSDITRAEAINNLQRLRQAYIDRHTTSEMKRKDCKDDVASYDMAINSLQIDEQYDLMYEQAEPKTGHWIKSKDQYGNFHYECSECGNDIATQSDYSGDNYCLECGARMVEPQESEDKEWLSKS